MFKIILLISLGGAFGAPSRYLFNTAINNLFQYSFPIGTLTVNIIGSFLIGIVTMTMKNYQFMTEDILRYFFMIGFLGSFTTFSAFSIEVINMYNSENYYNLVLYVMLSLLLNFLAAFLGIIFFKIF